MIDREIGNRQGEGIRLFNLGIEYRGLGEIEQAREHYAAALQIFVEIESPYAEDARRELAELDEQ